jgi:hypothetical protein
MYPSETRPKTSERDGVQRASTTVQVREIVQLGGKFGPPTLDAQENVGAMYCEVRRQPCLVGTDSHPNWYTISARQIPAK